MITLKARPRGFHLITNEITEALEFEDIQAGLLHLFLMHTSASLTINENADPSVRRDFLQFTDRLVPENEPYYTHILEGSEDMPAHIKSSLYGNALTIPITNGKMILGTWQGIYLCEHRDFAGNRKIYATIIGE
ncbi:secondary thiamine-phosphate synthase enzyme YjbQ [Nitratiruptor sp. YY08-14]|uniref:secondary thiamine-phosphate synthase enzyme YjbQ n=1 Tax=unclassified Nitratiruptor TaxID=2624044 RepID=UPI00351BFA5C